MLKEELLFGYLRPYHVENNGSRQISEIKLRKACLVLAWETAWEQQCCRLFFSLLFCLGSMIE